MWPPSSPKLAADTASTGFSWAGHSHRGLAADAIKLLHACPRPPGASSEFDITDEYADGVAALSLLVIASSLVLFVIFCML